MNKSIPVVGDTVGFAKPFLRSIQASATDDIWRERGTVIEIKGYGKNIPPLAYVKGFQTSNPDGIAHVLLCNIAVIGSFRHVEAEK